MNLFNVWGGIFIVLFMALAPGILGYRLFWKEKKMFLPLVFGFSALSIFGLGFGLSVLGLYTRLSVYIISGLILLGLLWGRYKSKDFWKMDIRKEDWWLGAVFFLLSFKRVGLAVFYPFIVGDAWASWNRWAVEWFRMDKFSLVNDFTYPQLLPVNFSFIYNLWGSLYSGEYLSGAFTLFFSLFILLILARWRSRLSKWGIFAGAGYLLVNQSSFFSVSIGDGLADVPVTFFVLLSLYLWQEYEYSKDKKYLYLTLVMAGGAALTKQAGLFYWLILPVMILIYEKIKDKKDLMLGIKDMIKPWMVSLGMVLIWYGVQQFSQADTLGQIQEALAGRSILNRLAVALYITVQNLGVYLSIHTQSLWWLGGIIFLAGIIFVFGWWWALRKSLFYRVLFFIFFLPYSILWALVYSYDVRNFLIVLIPLTFVAIDGCLVKIEDRFNLDRLKSGLVLGLLIVLFLLTLGQRPVYAHMKNPFTFRGALDDFMIKVGRVSLEDEGLVRAYIEARNRGKNRLITNDGPFVTKLHLEEEAVIGFGSVGPSGIDFEPVLGSLEEVDIILIKGVKNEASLLTKQIESVLGNKGLKLLYNNSEKETYLFEIEK